MLPPTRLSRWRRRAGTTRFVAVLAPEAADYYLLRDGEARLEGEHAEHALVCLSPRASRRWPLEGPAAAMWLWDIQAIEHHSGTGGVMSDGSRGQLDYDSAVYFVQRANGTFTDESAHLNWSCAKGKKAPEAMSIRDLRKAAGCVSALGH